MKRTAIYVRVSTDEQADKGYSLQNQVESCRRFAEVNNLSVVEEYSEDYSGAKLDERPALKELRKKIRAREIDAVVVWSHDRWSRNLAHIQILRSELRKAGVDLLTVQMGKVEDTPMGRFIENQTGSFSELWRDMIVEFCKSGKNVKAQNGKPVLVGSVPFGYRKEGSGKNARYVIFEPEARIVRQVFQWYVHGDGVNPPLSMRSIANRLELMNTPKPNGKKTTAEYWYPNTIKGILKNEIYAGQMYYGKLRVVDGRRTKQPQENWMPIQVPELAIIEPNTFKAAQVKSQRNKELSRRNRKIDFLLSGFFRCGCCGRAMVGYENKSTSTGHSAYLYQCSTHWKKSYKVECDNERRSIVSWKIEDAAWSWVMGLLTDEQALLDGIRAMIERTEDDVQPLRDSLATIEDLIGQAERKVKRLMTQFSDAEEDNAVLALVKDEIRRTAKEKDALEVERRKVQSELNQRSITPEIEQDILKIAAELREELAEPDIEIRRFALEKIGFQATYFTQGLRRWVRVQCGLCPTSALIEQSLS